MQNTLTLNLPFSIIRYLSLKLRINLKMFGILSFIAIVSLLIFYVFQSNVVISEGYQIQKYNKKLNELSGENKILEINFAKINSLENIEVLVKESGFEKIGKIYYIQVLESQIVRE